MYDSHYKVLENIEDVFLKKGWQTQYIYLNKDNKKDLVTNHKILNVKEIQSFFQDNIIITAIGGRYLNYIKSSNPYATIVSLYPGIIVHQNIEDLITKSTSDILLLNSKKDMSIYNKIASSLGIKNNAIVYGVGWYKIVENTEKNNKKDFLFIEQSDIPYTDDERKKLVEKLYLITINNDCHCYIKLRITSNINTSPNKQSTSLDKIVKELNYDDKIKFVNKDLNLLIGTFQNIVGISTSALLEAIIAKKNVFVLNDFGDNKYFVDFFEDSGLVIGSSDVIFNKSLVLNKNWYNLNITNPTNSLEMIYDSIENYKKENDSKIMKDSLKYFFIRILFKLSLTELLTIGIKNLYRKSQKSFNIMSLQGFRIQK